MKKTHTSDFNFNYISSFNKYYHYVVVRVFEDIFYCCSERTNIQYIVWSSLLQWKDKHTVYCMLSTAAVEEQTYSILYDHHCRSGRTNIQYTVWSSLLQWKDKHTVYCMIITAAVEGQTHSILYAQHCCTGRTNIQYTVCLALLHWKDKHTVYCMRVAFWRTKNGQQCCHENNVQHWQMRTMLARRHGG